MSGTLIVGASQAGVQLAASLRELGDTAPITLVGDEPWLPYQRPPLSKKHLPPEADREGLDLRTAEWYRERDIRVVTGEWIVDATRDADGGTAVGASGRAYAFDRLALATGTVPRRLELPGSSARGISTLRTRDDAERIAADLRTARRVVVVGGGFIGLELAAGIRSTGREVTVLEAASRLVGRVVAEPTSEFYLAAHRRRGIVVQLGVTIERFEVEHERVTGVVLGDGRMLPADLVLVGIGVVPRVDLAERLGLEISGGIVVDERALASDGVTVAAGDCAVLPSPYDRAPVPALRLESVHHAVEHAKVAAATLLGIPASYRTVPWFWSDQADLKLQIAGLSAGYDRVVLRGDPETERFSVLYYRGGLLLAADSVNVPLDHIAVKNALKHGQTIDPDRAGDASVPLKTLVQDLPSPAGVR